MTSWMSSQDTACCLKALSGNESQYSKWNTQHSRSRNRTEQFWSWGQVTNEILLSHLCEHINKEIHRKSGMNHVEHFRHCSRGRKLGPTAGYTLDDKWALNTQNKCLTCETEMKMSILIIIADSTIYRKLLAILWLLNLNLLIRVMLNCRAD